MKIKLLYLLFCLISAQAASGQNTLYWRPTNGPEGGTIHQIAAQGDRLWAAGYGGLYYSDNSGDNWTRHPISPVAFAVEGVCEYNGVLYALWRERHDTTDWLYDTRIVLARSADQGESWQFNKVLVDDYDWFNVANLYVSGGVLIVHADLEKFFRTTNAGQSWEPLEAPNAIYADWLSISRDFLSIIGDDGALHLSDNGGEDWFSMNNFNIDIFDVTGTFAIDSTLIVGAGYDTLIVSYDLGQHWQPLSIATAPDFSAVFKEGPGDTLFCFSNDVWYSIDKGHSWDVFTTVNAFAYPWTHLPNGVLVGPYYYGGIARMDRQTDTWHSINNGLNNQYVFQIADAGQTLWANTVDSIAYTQDNGFSWHALARRADNKAFAACDGNLYAAISNRLLRFRQDLTVDTLIELSDIEQIDCYENKLVVRQHDSPPIFYVYDPQTTDFMSINVPEASVFGEMKLMLLGNRLIYCNGEGKVFISDDMSQTWENTFTSSDPWINSIVGMYIVPPRIFLILELGFAVSGGGDIWEEIDAVNWPIGQAPKYMLEKDGRWYAALNVSGVDPVVIESADNGQNWNYLQQQPSVEYINDLKWHQNRLFVATRNSGVWRADYDISAQNEPGRRTLSWRPSPNPAAHWVELPPDAQILKAVNTMGASMPARLHLNRLDVSGWPNGVYFIQIEKSGIQNTAKIVVNRQG